MFDEFDRYILGLDRRGLLVEPPEGYGRAYLEKTLADVKARHGVIFVAEADGRVVGFVVGVIVLMTEIGQMEQRLRKPGEVTELYVDGDSRSRGIGAQLLERIEEWFREQGCDAVRIEVFAPNLGARRFYQRYGYGEWVIMQVKEL